MIPGHKSQNALRSLNHVLVLTRKMAHDGEDHGDIAEVLDVAEYLVRLLAGEEDGTAAFRECLKDFAARWPSFGSALQYFDQEGLSWPW